MVLSNHISPGMVLLVGDVLYRVESCVKVTVAKGQPFMKAKLRHISTDKLVEKNFKLETEIKDVALEEKYLEFLYPESDAFLFLDYADLKQVLVPASVIGDKVFYLKEGTKVLAAFYGDIVFSIELPQYLELMIVKISEGNAADASSNKQAVVETGAKVSVPSFVESGDVIKIDTRSNEYIQRV